MGNNEEDSEDWHNPNAEDYVLQPGQKRVRFSFCEPIPPPPEYNEDEEELDDCFDEPETPPSTFQQVRARRRDSVYPAVIMEHDKSIMIDHGIPKSSKREGKSDPFDNLDLEEEPSTSWSELSSRDKLLRIGIGLWKTLALLALLYFFVCSLDLLSKGFRLIGGRTAGEIFRQSDILQNPVVGVMIGILTTVLVQSSSTSTSIIVGMVAAGFMDVKLAIPIIMGANIGTSITNTIVSFMQAAEREQFRRAFAGATILDMFNWITVIVLLIVEVLTGYLYRVSKAWVDVMIPDPEAMGEIKLLSALTEPFVNLIVQLDESVLKCWSNPNCTEGINDSLIKKKCRIETARIDVSERIFDAAGHLVSSNTGASSQQIEHDCVNEFLFAGTSLSDGVVGAIVLVGSLIVLCTCLILIVKLLSSVLQGHVSVMIKKVLNADIPYVPWITGYIAILVGALMTFVVQSSSVFTSALTPLVGLGVISLDRVYPLTLGANIGTTTTAILASFAVDPKSFAPSMQIALCHFLFNVTGILLFYPIPFTRFPIHLAKFLGNTTAKYRWFAILYMVLMFVVVPAVFISLSFAGPIYVIILVSIIGLILMVILVITLLQKRLPKALPQFLRTWKWLPLPLRSLQPYDNLMMKLPCCAKCRQPTEEEGRDENSKNSNFTYYSAHEISEKDPNLRDLMNSNKDVEVNYGYQNGHIPAIDNNGNRHFSIENENDNYNNSDHDHNTDSAGTGNQQEQQGKSNDGGSDNEAFEGSTESVTL